MCLLWERVPDPHRWWTVSRTPLVKWDLEVPAPESGVSITQEPRLSLVTVPAR